MSNQQTAEERARTVMTLGKLHERGELDYPLETATREFQSHTNQRLSELRERVEELYPVPGTCLDYAINREDVLNLIDELTEHNQ